MPGLSTPAGPLRSASPPRFADVAVPRRLNRTFTYRIPIDLEKRIHVGSLVRIPFGPSTLIGLVVAVSPNPPADAGPVRGVPARQFRDILALQDREDRPDTDTELLSLAHWMSAYYVAPLGQCTRAMMPAADPVQGRISYVLTDEGRAALNERVRMSPTCFEIARRLVRRRNGLRLDTLRRAVDGAVPGALRQMQAKHWIEKREPLVAGEGPRGDAAAAPPRPLAVRESGGPDPDRGTSWADCLERAFSSRRWTPVLLQAPAGIRASRFVAAVQAALDHERTALVVTGEIDRAGLLDATFRSRWGDRVQLLHGRLSPGARSAAWTRIRQGLVDVVVGTRSAVFAPLRNLGLIGVDGEGESSLKQEHAPRYHAREVAGTRARHHRAVLLLGSEHPSLETLAAVRAHGGLIPSMDERPPRPSVELVDLRRAPYGTILSEPMLQGIEAALGARLAVVLYHNRKGFAPMLLCRDCGTAPRCQRCSVALTYHRRDARLRCGYCGATAPVGAQCGACLGVRVEPFGTGTEGVEEEVRRRFPRACVARMDRAALRGSAPIREIRDGVRAGRVHVVIGTQLLRQDPPMPPAGFVGVPMADLGLHLPDFRAAEKTHQALLDAIGLALPAESGGRVVLQTHLPGHPVMEAAATGDPSRLYEAELAVREALMYPPFGTLITLRACGKEIEKVEAGAQAWATLLQAAVGRRRAGTEDRTGGTSEPAGSPIVVSGPIRARVSRIRGRYRSHLLVRSRDGDAAREVVRSTADEMGSHREWRDVKFEVDVDPIEF